MASIIKTEFYKMKRYSVIWIGVATMLTVVLLSRFMATASDGASHTLMNFSSNVIWNNLVLIYPATITLIAGYMIDRERTDDTLKNILTIPVSFRKLLVGKLVAVGCMAIVLSAVEFLFTIMIFLVSGFPGFTAAGAGKVLFQMIGINLSAYLAVMPFTFFYGFVGMMASGHGLRDIYPITAGLTLIGYDDGSGDFAGNSILSIGSLLIILGVTVVVIATAKNRERSAENKKRPRGKNVRGRKVRRR